MSSLSVIVPTRNTAGLTRRCLESILVAAPPGTETIVVDDSSSDGTARMVATEFPESALIASAERLGFTAAVNRGLSQAGGEILLLLNSDTEVAAGSLAALVEAFQADPGLGAAGGQLYFPSGEAQWSGGRAPTLPWLFVLAGRLAPLMARIPGYRAMRRLGRRGGSEVDWVSGASLALRRAAWTEVGPLDEDYRFYCQDLDYCLRLRRAGWGVAIVSGFRVAHHHGATISSESGTAGDGQHLELLWSDLLLWAAKHRGPLWRKLARLALFGGTTLSLGRLLLRRPWVAEPAALRRERQALRGALAVLR